MLATNHIFMVTSYTFAFAAIAIWLAPKPKRAADTSAVH
jgi:DHA2 family multidrug resistance protein